MTRRDPIDLLEAWALDAVDAHERAAVDALLEERPELRVEAMRLRRAASLLVGTDVIEPARALRERVLTAATDARRAGRAADGIRPAPPLAALRRQVADLEALLVELTPEQWRSDVDDRFTVHHLAAHLVAVANYSSSTLDHGDFVPPAGTEAEHVAMTLPTVDALVARPVEETRVALHDAMARLLDQLDAMPLDARIAVYGASWSVQQLVAARVFEVWAHAEDMRRAIGTARHDPEPADLSLLCTIAVLSLPAGLAKMGTPRPDHTVKLVLTGPGGATFTQRMGVDAPVAPQTSVVVEAIDFCRLAARGLTVDELRYDAFGDLAVVADVLVAAQAFAA